MCKAIIHKWCGRFGNNIMQIAQCCDFAFHQNSCHSISFPSHELLVANKIQNTNSTICNCDKTIFPNKDTHNFFYYDSDWLRRRLVTQRYILPIISKKITRDYENTLFDCCVHIRSGDICNVTTGNYKKLSLEYYLNVINDILKNNSDKIKIHIIFEDSRIDVFKPLVKHYDTNPNVTYTYKTSIEEALNTMMRSNILVSSVGTFNMIAMCMSKTIHTLYVSTNRFTGSEKKQFMAYSNVCSPLWGAPFGATLPSGLGQELASQVGMNQNFDNFVKIQIF